MSIYNIQSHDKIIKNNLLLFVFLGYRQNSYGLKSVRISHGKRAIGVRAIEARL